MQGMRTIGSIGLVMLLIFRSPFEGHRSGDPYFNMVTTSPIVAANIAAVVSHLCSATQESVVPAVPPCLRLASDKTCTLSGATENRNFMPTSAPYRILCVDDEASGLRLRQLILERKGYLVSTASTVSEALALFKSTGIALVVTDHLLDRETGAAMAKEMKRLKPTVPIIVLSGTTETLEGMESIDAFISKAEGTESLLAKVTQLFARSEAASANRIPDVATAEEPYSAESPRLLGEQSMQNSERLAVSGRMAATVAHEINNPLEAATNALYLLAESPSLDNSARQFLTIAQEELARIRQIATLTLGLHRRDAEQPEQVKVSELIDNVLLLYGRKLRTLGVTIETRYDGEVPVNAFPGELRQVLSNLIVNAADALEKSGDKLCIHVFESLDWTNLAQRGLRITISDNGCGIPADKRAQIFEPFYTTKGSKGTGIGLSVSLGIVKKYRGTIRFRSILKQGRSGTTFSIFLPVAQNAGAISTLVSAA
jgi:signal transduction histidine kinase